MGTKDSSEHDGSSSSELRKIRQAMQFVIVAALVAGGIFLVTQRLNDQDQAGEEGEARAECFIEGVRLGLPDAEIERRCEG